MLVATPGRLVDLLQHSDNVYNDPMMSALDRMIMDALDEKSTDGGAKDGSSNGKQKQETGGRRGPSMDSSLTLKEIQEMDLDQEDDDGCATLDEMLHQLDYFVVDEANRLLGGHSRMKWMSYWPSSQTTTKEVTHHQKAKQS